MLNRKLDFIEFFYETAAEPFEVALVKIKNHEPPYDEIDIENGEPPFTEEWIEHNDGLLMLGNQALSLVSVALLEYLAASLNNLGFGQPPKGKGGYLQRYRRFVLELLGFDIADLGSDFSLIEEIVLARNRVQHAGDIGTNWVYQDEEYAKRYPRAAFAMAGWVEIMEPEEGDVIRAPLAVTAEKVEMTMGQVRKFCALLEEQFMKRPEYW
jgi:hypothetical protein